MKLKTIALCSALSALALGIWLTAGYAMAASPSNKNYWKEVTFHAYSFNIPAAWTTDRFTEKSGREGATFLNKQGQYVGKIVCSPQDDGGPEMPYSTISRKIENNETTHDIRLRIFYPSLEINRRDTMLTLAMTDESIKPDLENPASKRGCNLTVENADNLVPLFTQIYQSVKVKASSDWNVSRDEDHNWKISTPPGYEMSGGIISDKRTENWAPVMTVRYFSGMGEGPDLKHYSLIDADPISYNGFDGIKMRVVCGENALQDVYYLKRGASRWLIQGWECHSTPEMESIVKTISGIR